MTIQRCVFISYVKYAHVHMCAWCLYLANFACCWKAAFAAADGPAPTSEYMLDGGPLNGVRFFCCERQLDRRTAADRPL